ncbi:ABC transporter permease [Bradymonas sediminis]|uniref:Uncharacterized protein n=1 Tax=Bradymonas sediminis TaxID=1548548 RepID=A0A2Z4FNF0_9DELT|nr:ABC transporter permease subunit [Bradymonas sediminis]AWV90473.1 hypothetical protein DN745_14500 [Bradymonas sediminis]TDP72139.1 ABC-type transport system involved in multi-copper enzyme maturation permease subunit [Bradymonas sediminis]
MAIHEQKYISYDGPLKLGSAWLTFARMTFGMAMRLKRTWAMLVLLWFPVLITLLLVFAEYGAHEKLPEVKDMLGASGMGTAGVSMVLQMQFFSAALLMMVVGCGAIAEDLRYQTFQLYFSRPVERWEYLLGKFLGLFGLCSLVTVLPALLLGGLRASYFARSELATEAFTQSAVGLGMSVGITVLVCSIVLGLSSLTRRTGYAVLAFVGVILVPQILSIIVALSADSGELAQLWSLPGNLWLATQLLLAETAPEVPLVAPFAILAATAGLGLYAMFWRVNKLEGIA